MRVAKIFGIVSGIYLHKLFKSRVKKISHMCIARVTIIHNHNLLNQYNIYIYQDA